MIVAVYLPLLASVLVVPRVVVAIVRVLPDTMPPRYALWLLTVSTLMLGAASTAALALLTAAAAARIPAVARVGEWSPEVLASRQPWAVPIGVVAGAVLVVLTIRTVVVAARIVRRYQQVAQESPGVREGGDIVLLEDPVPYAVARPRWGTRPAQVVVSSGMWTPLGERERLALVAHERAHLEEHHHLLSAVATLAEAVNPLLAPLRRDVGYAVERCADEAAAQSVGDRELVAGAVARAALLVRSARSAPPTVGLGMSSGRVPRRVSALLSPAPSPRPARWCAALSLLVVAVSSLAAALHAGVDLDALLEVAEVQYGAF